MSLNRNKIKECKKIFHTKKVVAKKMKEAAFNNKSNFLHTHNFFSSSEQKYFMAFLVLFLSPVHVLFFLCYLDCLWWHVLSGFNGIYLSLDSRRIRIFRRQKLGLRVTLVIYGVRSQVHCGMECSASGYYFGLQIKSFLRKAAY